MEQNSTTTVMADGVGDPIGERYDAVVIGGGAAGLSGGLMLARARRSVLVLDAGAPRNAPAQGVHGLLAREGLPPAELVRLGQAEVRSYGGKVAHGTVADVRRVDSESDGAGLGFEVVLSDGRTIGARRVLVATGLVDDLPDLPGLREQWGSGVIHCPYCHGWEMQDQPLGILAAGPMAVHHALLFRQWTDDIVLFTRDLVQVTPEQVEQLTARGTRIVEGEVAGLELDGDRVVGVRMADGTVVPRSVVAIGAPMIARLDFLAGLGLLPVQHSTGMGEHLAADPFGRTVVPGVWAAGNVTDLSAQVGAAAAAAAFAAAQMNMELVLEDTDRAVREARAAVPVA